MKIVIAPQGFKGNLSAIQVARAIEAGVERVLPEATSILKPVADGGEGTLQALVDSTRGEIRVAEVTGPLGERVTAKWGILGDGTTAVIEMAAASGLILVPPAKRNPLVTTSYGTGELITTALEAGCRKLIIGIGGSATNDGGAGMAQALGAHLFDACGKSIDFGGGALARLERIDVSAMDPRLSQTDVLVACDVTNPLCGSLGASNVYGPQKGADTDMVKLLDEALAHYAGIICRDLGVNVMDLAGAGAAGGMGAGLVAFLRVRLVPGVDIVIEASGLNGELKDADIVFTGEGRIDSQTAFGKAPVGVAREARKYGVPVIVIAGDIAEGYQDVYQHGIDAVVSIAPGPITLTQAMADAEELISGAAERALRLFLCGTRMKILDNKNENA